MLQLTRKRNLGKLVLCKLQESSNMMRIKCKVSGIKFALLDQSGPTWQCSHSLFRLSLILSWYRSYHIETSPLICRANQWTGSYMAGISVMK